MGRTATRAGRRVGRGVPPGGPRVRAGGNPASASASCRPSTSAGSATQLQVEHVLGRRPGYRGGSDAGPPRGRGPPPPRPAGRQSRAPSAASTGPRRPPCPVRSRPVAPSRRLRSKGTRRCCHSSSTAASSALGAPLLSARRLADGAPASSSAWASTRRRHRPRSSRAAAQAPRRARRPRRARPRAGGKPGAARPPQQQDVLHDDRVGRGGGGQLVGAAAHPGARCR